jgi:hypothetical protein
MPLPSICEARTAKTGGSNQSSKHKNQNQNQNQIQTTAHKTLPTQKKTNAK